MLELYHWEPNGASARVLIALHEKGLAFESRYVDLMAFEQHQPAFVQLNPTGEVPVLVQGGEPFTQSSYICAYLEEAFPQRPLMPADAYQRWEVRVWQKSVDDHLAAAVSDLAWTAYGPKGMAPDLGRLPSRERRDAWAEALRGYDAERLDKARERVGLAVGRMEQALERADWLAAGAFSLADIAVFAYAAYLPRLEPALVSQAASPRTMAWLERVASRPGVQAALAMARTPDPFGTAAPGPEHVRWG